MRPSSPSRSSSYTSLTSALSWTLSRLTAAGTDHAPHLSPPPPSAETTPSRRSSPFTPPPLTPLTLHCTPTPTPDEMPVLTPTLAEEIRLLLPPRLQLHDTWSLAYALASHGVSLATLYARASTTKCAQVLLVRDALGGVFGAFINEPLSPHERYYGTGECFLWKYEVAPPPARFKAFAYSGINDYMVLCSARFLSIGGGEDGKYGLWLDSCLEKGVTARCAAFGNEPLSEGDGGKFEIMDVEVWRVGVN